MNNDDDPPLTPLEHLDRHRFLHQCLDELIADWIWHTRQSIRTTSVAELMRWSFLQTLNPTEKNE